MSSRLSLRQLTASAVALACGWLLAFGGGVAQAGYVHSGSFPVGAFTSGLAVDQSTGSPFSGEIYAASESTGVEQFAESGTRTAVGAFGGTATGVAVDPTTHDVYAYEPSAQVEEFDPSTGAQIGEPIGAGTITPGGEPRIWVDSSGDVFVPVRETNVVDEFTPTAPNSNVYTSAPIVIGGGALTGPAAVAVDSAGNVYVLDSNPSTGSGRVQEFSPAGTLEGELGAGSLSNAFGITVDTASNDVFVVDNGSEGVAPHVAQFEPSQSGVPGSRITSFGSGEVGNSRAIAVSPVSKDVYVAGLFASEALIFVPAQGPEAKTQLSEAVTATGATLNGTVITQGSPTHWYFEFGPSETYGEFSPAPPGPETAIDTTVQTTLTGLQPNKTYHYQLIANNPNGTAKGGDQTLTTLAVRPSVHGQASLAVSQTGATLQAQINPNNEPTHYFFEYGTDTGYALGTVPSPPGPVGEGYGDALVSAPLSGLQPNTLYHYRVIAVNAAGTSEGVDRTLTTLPNGPSVTTGAASGVGQSAATLTGAIDSQGAETSYYFEYSGPGTFSIVSGKAGSGSGNATVTAPVNGLSPGAAYQYRLIATNAGGTTFGSYQTFTTAPPPPSGPPAVATGGTSNLTPSSATLAGTVDPSGGATSYQFQYGTTAAYGASLPEASAGSVAEAEGVVAGLSGLAPGTAYHYRLVATNAAGTTYGADQTFTTPAAPVSVFGPLPTNTIAPTTTTKPTTPKPLTRAQKLSKALKACKKEKSKAKRAKCEKEARKKYGTKAKRKK
jgi:hypothetical protein